MSHKGGGRKGADETHTPESSPGHDLDIRKLLEDLLRVFYHGRCVKPRHLQSTDDATIVLQ